MDPQTWLLILGVGALTWLAFRRPRPARRQRDLSDVMSGLFRHSADLGWPAGVQEEDTIRPWGVPGSSDRGHPGDPAAVVAMAVAEADAASAVETLAMTPEAVIEDDVSPVEVSRVRRAA